MPRRKRKHPGGRPPLPPGQAKTVTIAFRPHPDELRAYEICAAAERLTVGAFVRAAANRYVTLSGNASAGRALLGEHD